MKKNKKRLILGASILLNVSASASLWGCSELETQDGPIEWNISRTTGNIVGFIDDSLVIVSDWRAWSQELATFITNNGGYRTGIGHQGLRIYNYRVQEDGPRWTDTLDNENTESFTYLKGQLSDSVIWGGNGVNSFSFWKLGKKPVVKDVSVIVDGCTTTFTQESLKIWLRGTIFMRGPFGANGDSCHYAILDTIAKTLTYKRLGKDLEWIGKCDDVRAWGDDVYCVILDDEGEKSLVLKNKDDTIPTPRKFAIGGFWGDMIKLSGNICSMDDDKIICSDVIWYGNELMFYQNDEVIVKY